MVNDRFSKNALSLTVVLIYALGYAGGSWALSDNLTQKNPIERWNPTRVPVGTELIGDQACAECHKNKFVSQLHNAMRMAMEPVDESKVLTANPIMAFRLGPYSYEIRRKEKQSLYTVTDGKETITLPILYAFGEGKAGQTYLVEYNGEYYESLVSYYKDIRGLDFTVGTLRTIPASIQKALGRRLSENETLSCFGCHSTGAVRGGRLHLEKMAIGIRCEGCHGPGGQHVAAGKKGEPSARLIFNPKRLSGDELTQEFCAACHRGNDDFTMLKSMETNNVRFQPYRIFNSKCYSDDRRISCTACHDPHEPLKQDAGYYDAKCMACHAPKDTATKIQQGASTLIAGCKVGLKDCASCHMPKVAPPGSHFTFTDHYIRIAKPNEAYPN
jgi:hypothetical protein